jgi:acetate---CoA ligase (ADP-forming)
MWMPIGAIMNNSATMRISSNHLLEPFFAPRGVAVIGASPKLGNQGRRIVESLFAQGFEGRITTVHPKGLSVSDVDSVTRIKDLPEDTDLAIAAISATHVPELIKPLANQGIHNLIVISGGFAETGEEGKGLQHDLQELCRKWGVRIIGPNCLGIFSAPDHFNSFFLSPEEIQFPDCGSIAIISQSGAFLSSILDQLAKRGLGVHRAINFGNRIDIGECEVLEAFVADPAVKVIGIYLESVQEGHRFFEIARSITKPIVICKGGKSEKGHRAIQAHSASLAGSYDVFKTACKQAGIIEVQGLGELINALHVLSIEPAPLGNKVLIVSNGGGMGVLLTDLCEQGECIVEEPPFEIQQELKKVLPGYYSFKNPIDLTGSGTNEQCTLALDKLLNLGIYDCLLLVILSGTEGINADIATPLQSILPENFPVVLGAYGKTMYPQLCANFHKNGIPVFPSGEEAAWAINLLNRTGKQNSNLKSFPTSMKPSYNSLPLQNWLVQTVELPDEMQFKEKLSECGVQIPRRLPAAKRDCLDKVIKIFKLPITLKVIGKDIQHKTEIKGIRIDIYLENTLVREWKNMNKTWPGQIWAEEQMPPGLDLIVGMQRDVDFGPVLLVGTGGKYVEVYRDIERIVLPADDDEIRQAIFRTRVGRVIQGFRGESPLDILKLLDFIKLIAKWVEGEPKIRSLDFNPIRLYQDSLVVLDAKMVIDKNFQEGKNHEH